MGFRFLSEKVGIPYLCGKRDARVFLSGMPIQSKVHSALRFSGPDFAFRDPIRAVITSDTGMNAPKRSFSHAAANDRSPPFTLVEHEVQRGCFAVELILFGESLPLLLSTSGQPVNAVLRMSGFGEARSKSANRVR